MNTKRSALFFVFLICTSHIGNSLANSASDPPKTREGCEITSDLELKIDSCLKEVSLHVEKDIQVEDQSKDGFKISDCHCQGLDNIKRTTHCTCECYKDFIRIYVNVSIFDVLFSFLLSLDGILGGLLAGLVDTLVALLQKVVNLLVKLLVLKIDIVIVLEQRFSGGPCSVIDVILVSLGKIQILGLDLTPLIKGLLQNVLDPILSPILKTLITNLIPLIKDAFRKLIIEKGYHNCPTTGTTDPPVTIRPPVTMRPPVTRPPCNCDG